MVRQMAKRGVDQGDLVARDEAQVISDMTFLFIQ